jgi:hypothetical protein
MKKITYIGLFVFILTFTYTRSASAQEGEKIKSLRIATYTDVLKLTPQEAKVFWPVFEEYQKKLKDIQMQEKIERNQAVKNWNLLTDTEASVLLDKMIEFEQKQVDLKKQYIDEFKKVLPVKKVLLLRKAELQFKKALLEKIKNADTE